MFARFFIFIFTKLRVIFFKLLSLNSPDYNKAKYIHPVQFMGKGRISIGHTSFGIFTSPGVLCSYSVIDARTADDYINIGDGNVFNNKITLVSNCGRIDIGNNNLIGSNFFCINSDFHEVNSSKINNNSNDIVIGNNVFIGDDVKILKGVKVGDSSVIGSGSVVTKNIPENTMFAGVPAKFIRVLK